MTDQSYQQLTDKSSTRPTGKHSFDEESAADLLNAKTRLRTAKPQGRQTELCGI